MSEAKLRECEQMLKTRLALCDKAFTGSVNPLRDVCRSLANKLFEDEVKAILKSAKPAAKKEKK